ncbi:MAG: amidohydrolase family protein, partial [Candidatus Rokuibacteriota bacterium]
MKTLFHGGTVINADETIAADLLVEEERIVAVGRDLRAGGAGVVDAAGLLLLPGGIDVHTHLDMPLEVAGQSIATADDFYTGQVAAAFGGTTAHLDFAIQPKGASLRETLDLWRGRAAGKAVIDYGFHMTIADPRPEVLREIAELPGWGINTVKVLMAYKGRLQVDDATLFAVFREAAPAGVLTMVHCE